MKKVFKKMWVATDDKRLTKAHQWDIKAQFHETRQEGEGRWINVAYYYPSKERNKK